MGVTAFTCDGFCGGGDAIVFQQRVRDAKRAVGNSAEHNLVTGRIPDGLDEFGMTGAEGTHYGANCVSCHTTGYNAAIGEANQFKRCKLS